MASRRRILTGLRQLMERNDRRNNHYKEKTDHLITKGYVVDLMVLAPQTCDRLLHTTAKLVESRAYTTDVQGLSAPKNRMDIELPPRGYCWKILNKILRTWRRCPGSPWNRLKQKGVKPRLVEFAVLGSLPGSKNQRWHSDHSSGYGKLVSFGIPLVDVRRPEGPTECIPRGQNHLKGKRNPTPLFARRGHMYAWDGGITHRGTQNVSKNARPIFMFSLQFSKRPPTPVDQLSLHSDLKKRLV